MLLCNEEDEIFITGSDLSASELVKSSRNVTTILQGLPASFSRTLSAHMTRKGVTCERLAEACMLSRNSIFRFKKEEYDASYNIIASVGTTASYSTISLNKNVTLTSGTYHLRLSYTAEGATHTAEKTYNI